MHFKVAPPLCFHICLCEWGSTVTHSFIFFFLSKADQQTWTSLIMCGTEQRWGFYSGSTLLRRIKERETSTRYAVVKEDLCIISLAETVQLFIWTIHRKYFSLIFLKSWSIHFRIWRKLGKCMSSGYVDRNSSTGIVYVNHICRNGNSLKFVTYKFATIINLMLAIYVSGHFMVT